ncbi:M48 family metalloprotease [Arthrobacter cavernae]|uniref:M48 family metalloprotease n=1 Tax=Arthrobacter cavernae TaxID=2817681 RepID=A0A939HEJ5_9MICC|nr:M48 family metalloprotease [Arthrobacter cavernae]MBO1269424.1 M48 family metalloprotease [Arthrobacter cavernae]
MDAREPHPALAVEGNRVNVLAYPPPTTGQFVVFVAALLTAGLFVGTWLHNEILGASWTRSVLLCEASAQDAGAGLPPGEAFLARTLAAQQCAGPVERIRVLWSAGGTAMVALGAVALMYVRPAVIRRRRRLSRPTPAMRPVLERFAGLSAEAGLRRCPALFIGPTRMRDAFSFGVPGAYAVALPRKAVAMLQRPGVFDAVVRHELAHVRHGDVALAWLARSIWYVLGPVLLLPVVWAFIQGDLSLLPSYLWRVALLAVVVEVTSAGLLRSREHDADLAAARGQSQLAELWTCLGLLPARRTAWLRRVTARHPDADRRREVLESPHRAARIGFLDGLAAAFLAALGVPLVVGAAVTLTAGTGLTLAGQAAGALLAGPLLGITVGFGLWRAALMEEAAALPSTQPRFSRLAVAGGVAVGLALGQTASLAQTGVEPTGLTTPLWILVPVVLGAASVGLSASMATTWARAVRIFPRPWPAWSLAMMVNAVLFAAGAWMWGTLQAALDGMGWEGTRLWVLSGFSELPLVGAALFLVSASAAGLILAARARGRPDPGWLLDGIPDPAEPSPRGTGTEVPGLLSQFLGGAAAGAFTVAVLAVWRQLIGPLDTFAAREQLTWTVIWVCAAAWGAASLAGIILRPVEGAGAALAGGATATVVGVLGFAVINTLRGGPLTLELVGFLLRPALGLGFALGLTAGLLATLPWPAHAMAGIRSRLLLASTAAGMAAVAAVGVIASAPVLVGPPPLADGRTPGDPGGTAIAEAEAAEIEHYAQALAPGYLFAYLFADEQLRVAGNLLDRDPPAALGHLRSVVVPAVAALRSDVEHYAPRTQEVQSVHNELLDAIGLTGRKLELFATAIEQGDESALLEGAALQEEERRLLLRWQAGVIRLGSGQAGP